VHRSSISIDQVGTSDGLVTLGTTELFACTICAEDSLLCLEEVAIQGLLAAMAGEVLRVPVLLEG
jgi:hypothetical protein